MKKLIFSAIIFLSLIVNTKALDLSSKNIVLYNMNEDQIVYEMNKDEKTSIASLTKIMTTLVAIESIENYEAKVTLNYNMFKGLSEANAAVIGLRGGQTVTYNDLLYGMFISSGADATRAIAISVAGSEEAFVEMMNKKAFDLEMFNTEFKNTTGLDEEGQYSTVNDIAILLKEALKNEKFREIFITESYAFSDKSLTVYSTLRKTANNYGYDIEYIKGAKTGFTYDAGKCLASLALDSENNIEYLLVTTRASTTTKDAYHIKDAVEIYNYYFTNYKYHNIVEKGDLLVKLPTKYGKVDSLNIYALDDIEYYLNNTFKKDDITLKYNGIDIITTNMKKDVKLGEIQVIYNDEILHTFDIYLPKKIQFSPIAFIKENIKYFGIGTISFIILVMLIIKVIKRK